MAKVKKIRPSWELVNEDEVGNWIFEFTDDPRNYKPERIRKSASDKVMKEIESRMKL